jgi:hypothetical protein
MCRVLGRSTGAPELGDYLLVGERDVRPTVAIGTSPGALHAGHRRQTSTRARAQREKRPGKWLLRARSLRPH